MPYVLKIGARMLNSFVIQKYTHLLSCWRSQTAATIPTSEAFFKTSLQVSLSDIKRAIITHVIIIQFSELVLGRC